MRRGAASKGAWRARFTLGVAGALGAAGAFVACGSRTALPFDELVAFDEEDGRAPEVDALPPPDALPPLDVGPRPDVDRSDCPDAEATLVYMVTAERELVEFDPGARSFRRIGVLSCPAPPSASPFSMAVDRRGTAFVLYHRNTPRGQVGAGLYRVSTADGECSRTAFEPPVGSDFDLFGMGFATDGAGPSETLFVASARERTSRLARIDTDTFALTAIGAFVPSLAGAELTGNGAGDLFGFYSGDPTRPRDSFIMQIDKASATILAEDVLPGVDQGSGWAFAFWGGDFWLFTSPNNRASRVLRFRPSDKSLSAVAEYPGVIVGAGVSTCAPQ